MAKIRCPAWSIVRNVSEYVTPLRETTRSRFAIYFPERRAFKFAWMPLDYLIEAL